MKGFTLVEMLVVVALVGVLSIVVGNSVLSFFRAHYSSSSQSDSITAAQGALDSIIKDLRQADYGADGSSPIASISPNSMKFFSGANANGLSRRITIQLSGTSLTEIISTPSGIPPVYSGVGTGRDMADNVQNIPLGEPLFRYFDSFGNEITNFSQIASVASVTVTLSVNADPNHLHEFTLQSSATLRNLRKN